MKILSRPLVLLSFVLLIATPQPSAAQQGWKVGLARQKVTPSERVYLAGYAGRNKPFESVADDLYVKAMALEDAQGHRAVIITSDLIGYRAEFAEPICRRIEKQTGLARGQILLNSSHTHTGPLLFLNADRRARDMTDQQAADTVAYTRQLMDHTVDVAIRAIQDLSPARLSHGMGVASFVMNRRQPTPQGVRLGVNPSGLADRSVPVLRVDGPQGRLRGVLYGAACHNTTLTGRHYIVSGDYAGISQSLLQQRHDAVQAMFMMGCGGSSNPFPRGEMENALAHAKQLSDEVDRVVSGRLTPIDGSLRTEFDYVELPLARPLSADEIERLAAGRSGWQPWVAQQMQSVLKEQGELPTSYRCPLAVWQLGEELTLVALSGEVVVDYVPLIQRALGPLNLWIAGYCNDVFGYIPSARVLAEGGYETRGMIYGGIGFFSPEVEDVLVAKVRELALRAGRRPSR